MLDQFAEARRRAFVGRGEEVKVFEGYLAGPGGVLYVHGPGGVGKTALLRRFGWLCERAGRPVVWLDARDAGRNTPPLDTWLGGVAGAVLFVDAAEVLVPLDRWINEESMAGLAGDTIIVVASRAAPPLAWRVDPGWRSLLHTLPLANLSPAECATLLTDQGVPESEHAPVVAFTRGHPLALALVVDARAGNGGRLPDPARPEIVTALLDVLLEAVPGPRHRAALKACAQVRATTEPLLAALLDIADARELFDWLRGLSVIELGPRGLLPHDLVRNALATELWWRHPDRHREIRLRAVTYYRARLASLDASEKNHVLVDAAFLYRDHPIIGRALTAFSSNAAPLDGEPSHFAVVPARANDAADVIDMVTRHEGTVSAGLATHWMTRQPQNTFIVRDERTNGAAGYVQLVSLAAVPDTDRRTDPAVAAACAHVDDALRQGQAVTLVRFWMNRDTYQMFCPVQTEITLHILQHSLTTPDLAITLIACASPEEWETVSAYTHSVRVPGADFTVDGRTTGVFERDWRATSPLDWLALVAGLAEPPSGATKPAPPAPSAAELTSAQYAEAVRAALRDLNRVDRLRDSPLLASRLVTATRDGNANGAADRARALQQIIRTAADVLKESPRDVTAFRALHHTYLQPAGTQRRASDLLQLPMSTYRRHLAAGIANLVAIMWQQERDANTTDPSPA